MLNERGNRTNIEKVVPDCDHQSLQHFISNSQWDEEGVISKIQGQVSELIGNPVHGSVHLDESGFLKDCENSVGVKRQYCGRFGKVDNCQVGVFLGYALWSCRTLIDKRLKWKDKAPMLTIPDVREILEVILPRRRVTKNEILEIVKRKHKARESARKSHHKRNSKPN